MSEYALSQNQVQLWALQQVAPEQPTYNVYQAVRIIGPLDADILKAAFEATVAGHDSLRIRLIRRPHGVSQRVVDGAVFRYEDLSSGPVTGASAASTLLEAEAGNPFDLHSEPPIRGVLVKTGAAEHTCLLVIDHLVCDLWSLQIVFADLVEHYRTIQSTGRCSIPPRVQYRTFVEWQSEAIASGNLTRQTAYWANALSDLGELESSIRRTAAHEGSAPATGSRLTLKFSGAEWERLSALSRDLGVSTFVTLLSGYGLLLHKYFGMERPVIGIAVAGRPDRSFDSTVGLFSNLLPAVMNTSDFTRGREFLEHTGTQLATALTNQDVPFSVISRHLPNPGASGGGMPLKILMTFQNVPSMVSAIDRLRWEPISLEMCSPKCDLAAVVWEGNGTGTIVFEYDTERLGADTIRDLGECYKALLSQICRTPEAYLADLSLLNAAAQRRVATLIAHSESQTETDDSVPAMIAARARAAPDATAVVDASCAINYSELNEQAAAIGRWLKDQGVHYGDVVGLVASSGVAFIKAALGIWHAGAAYLPIDSSNPTVHQQRNLEAGAARSVVTVDERGAIVLAHDGLEYEYRSGLDDRPSIDCDFSGADLAYVVCTSGSQGRPKAVSISHRSLTNLVTWHIKSYGVTGSDRASQVAAISFDACVWEVWPHLAAGATVVCAPHTARRDASALAEWLRTERVSVAFVPTALCRDACEALAAGGSALRTVLTGGESLRPWRWSELPFKVANHYGPTESTVLVTQSVAHDSHWNANPPIGRPIQNVTTYVLDGGMAIVPPGVVGEIYIGGASVAQGYRGDPVRTADRFVPDPFAEAPGGRLFKTGDLGKVLRYGELAFCGRADEQVKIAGFRVEPGSAQEILRRHAAIADAAVIALERDTVTRLAAFIVPRTASAPSVALVRKYLQEQLPAYAIPSEIHIVEKLPVTPHGKLDTARLALLSPSVPRKSEAPDDVVAAICAAWSGLLGTEVSADSNFFALGGDSITALQVTAGLRVLGIDVNSSDLWQLQTPAAIAASLAERSTVDLVEPAPTIGDGSSDTGTAGDFALAGLSDESLTRLLRTFDARVQRD